MITLRPDQVAVVDATREALRAGARPVIVAPCGWGKGTVISWIIRQADQRGKRVQFLVNRRVLVHDMSRRLDRLGLDHGIIMGDHRRRAPWLNVHVASIDTLHRRENLPPADLLIIDEAHFALSPVWLNVLDRYSGVPRIGATATPIRLDGRGLGSVFNRIVPGPTVAEATELGLVVPYRIFTTPNPPDVSKVDIKAGEFNQRQLGAVSDKPALVGDIVSHWERRGIGRPTVVFAVTVEHSKHITERFVSAGHRWKHVDSKTPDPERDDTWGALESGQLEGVSSVGLISYGWDCPRVSCGILARTTESLALCLQQIGRIGRTAPGKDDALILDHAGNVHRHGLPDDPREWSLDDAEIKARASEDDPALCVRMCKKCWAAYRSKLSACPYCGEPYAPDPREIRHIDGELEEVRRDRWYLCACGHKGRLPEGATLETHHCPRCEAGPLTALVSKYDTPDEDRRRRKYMEWVAEAKEKGYKPAWPAVMTKRLYGTWPKREWVQAAKGVSEQQEMTA